jgi:hypothetical protein
MLSLLFINPKITSSNAPIREIGKSRFVHDLFIEIGVTKAQIPKIAARLKMFEPITFATAISFAPSKAEIKLTENSGIDVPNATTVSPIKMLGTFSRLEKQTAYSTKRSAP